MIRKIILITGLFLLFAFSSSNAAWKDYDYSTVNALNGVNMFDHLNGFAVGDNGLFIKTTDGAKTWSLISTGTTESFKKVKALSSNTALILSKHPDNDLFLAPNLYKFDGTSLSLLFNFSSLLELVSGWEVRGETVFVCGGGDSYNFLKSTDGGATWPTHQLIGGTKEVLVNSLCFIDDNTGWAAAVYSDNATGYAYKRIYKTTNAGNNWDMVYKEVIPGDPTGNPGEYIERFFATCLSNISSTDNNHIWVNYFLDGVLYSKNGGSNWNETPFPNIGLFDIGFINNNVGWVFGGVTNEAVSSKGIFLTVDGGSSWEVSKDRIFYSGDVLSNPTKVVAVGSAGAISVLEPPAVASISKTQFKQGTTETVTVLGSDFDRSYLAFSSSCGTIESVNQISSTELQVVLNIYPSAPIGPVALTIYNIDTTSTTEINAFTIISGEVQMTLSSVVPNAFLPSEESKIAITGANFPINYNIGSVEVDFGLGINAAFITLESGSLLTVFVTVEPTATAGPRNLTITIYDNTGAVIAAASKTTAITIAASPSHGALPESTDILPAVGSSGVWNPERDGDLTVQVKAPVAGSYDVMVATPAGIKYKKITNLSVGYNKVIIPSNLELTNGTHLLMLQDPKTGKLVKAKIVVIH